MRGIVFFNYINVCIILYRPGWLTRIIYWMVHSLPRTVIYRDSMSFNSNQSNPFATQSELEVNNNQLNEVKFIFQRIRVVYATLNDWNSSEADRVLFYFSLN